MAALLPAETDPIWIEPSSSFSPSTVWKQASILKAYHKDRPYDVVHGWAARDWELAALVGWRCGCPAIGTLHDHPTASFISGKRRRLMRWSAGLGLKRISCVSAAVQDACLRAGYPRDKLAVVRNGLPVAAPPPILRVAGPPRFGYLGTFSERKGLRCLFQIADQLASEPGLPWELHLAGGAPNEAAQRLLAALCNQYMAKEWWQRVHWHGWVESPGEFLKLLDVLIVPSSEFDPFPTVLLEAGQAGRPALAGRVGGVPEIVLDGQTGWLFGPGDAREAARILRRLIAQPDLVRRAGLQARQRTEREFPASKMVDEYLQLYANLDT